jgi:hypothetical protein
LWQVTYRTLRFGRPPTVQSCENIVKRRAADAGFGHVSPHDLRRPNASDSFLPSRYSDLLAGRRPAGPRVGG